MMCFLHPFHISAENGKSIKVFVSMVSLFTSNDSLYTTDEAPVQNLRIGRLHKKYAFLLLSLT